MKRIHSRYDSSKVVLLVRDLPHLYIIIRIKAPKQKNLFLQGLHSSSFFFFTFIIFLEFPLVDWLLPFIFSSLGMETVHATCWPFSWVFERAKPLRTRTLFGQLVDVFWGYGHSSEQIMIRGLTSWIILIFLVVFDWLVFWFWHFRLQNSWIKIVGRYLRCLFGMVYQC